MSDEKMPVQMQEMDGQLYAKVRIPVCINEAGEWIADGYWSRPRSVAKRDAEEAAAECGFGNVITHFVYALVPVPKGLVVPGELDC
jgi:hypothetical protein